jgi:hypothetical protein
MSEKKIDEKDEKELNKHDEKVEERDLVSTLVWGAILIWAGVAFLLIQQGIFNRFITPIFANTPMKVFEPDAWSLIALGAGVILLIEVVIRLLVPAYRRSILGTLILALVFVSIGVTNLFNIDWDLTWPLILIAIGVSVLLRGFTHKK